MQSPNTQVQTPPKPQTPSQSKVYVLPSTEELSNILSKLQNYPRAQVFDIPLPSSSSNGAPEVSQRPMDLGTVKKRLDSKQYTKTEDALADIQFIFQNAMKIYPKENTIHQSAIETANQFQQMVKTVIAQKTNAYNSQMAFQQRGSPLPTGRPNTPQIVSPSRFPLPPGYQYTSSNPLALLPLKDKVTKILDSIEGLKDGTGRQIAELFLDLPDKEEYPDYYTLITSPIALNDMRKKNYQGARQFITDIVLLVNNAQTYNLSGSFIYNDSRLIYTHFQRESQKYFPGENIPLSKDAQLRAAKKQKKGRGRKKRKDDDYGSESEESDEFDLEDDDLPDLGTPTASGKRKIDGFEIDDEVRRSKRPKATPTKEKAPEELELDAEIEEMETEQAQNSKFVKEPTIEDEEQKEKKATVEKILGDRLKKKEDGTPSEEFEYYVKWKGKSYIHCEWVDQSVILGESHGKTKVNRYHQSKLNKQAAPNEDEQEFFPEEYCEVERVIASKETLNKKTNKIETKYLVKWNGIGYSECTWEWAEDFKDDEKIAQFKKFNTPPIVADSKQHIKKKWIKLESSPKWFSNENILRPYQLEGMNWLTFCWHEGRGSILADEMGLGKTVQSIALLNYLRTQEGIRGPYLVVAPLSTLGHWYREIEEWTEMNVVMYQGNKHNREVARQYEWYYLDSKGEPINTTILKFNVLLTTYEMILSSDWQDLAKINWKVIIVDEAQRLKNQNSKLLENLRVFKSDHRVLLTGTPLQNNTQELWSLLNYIEPNKFSQSKEFMASFGQLENAEQVRKLHDILRPHLLRRLKEDVEKSIPPKEETLIEVELTSIQKQYYKAVLEKNRDFLNKGTVGKNVPNLLNVFMQLRKICNHPFLLNGVEEKELARAGSLEAYYKTFVDSSGKMVLLDKLLPKLKASGHKVLIFSQMVRVLDLLELYLKNRGYFYERLDGQVRRNERQASIDRFCKPGSDRFVFLLCTRAGGLGINLTAADTVIIYDSDWNPQNDIQAQARCHRIGQTQEVKVYRLITANSYERHMFERSSKKLGLDQAVLHDMGAPTQTSSVDKDKEKKPTLDKKEIDDLLKYGAYDLFREDNKEKERQFVEEDIDQILNRSSKVVWNESQAKIAANSSFSKATFRSSTADPDIDINDPNFWNKILPEARTAQKLLERLNKNVEALATKEKRAEFLHELETFVTDVVIAFREGRTEEASNTRNALIKVFDILKGNIDSFSDDQQRRIVRWQNEVTKFRRERRTTTRFGDAFENAYLGRGKDFFNGKDAWTENDRKKLHNLLFSLGPYRFKEVAKKCGVHRNLEEIREFTAEFLRQCIVHAEDKDRPYFIETLEIIFGPESLSEELDIQLDPRWSDLLKRKLKAWIRNIKQILVLNEMFKNGVEKFEFPKVNKPLASWWTAEEDKDLLTGVWKHGLGNYNDIKNDPTLCFVKHKAEIEAAEKADKEELKKVSEFSVQIKTEGEAPKVESETKSESVKSESEKKPETVSEPKPEEAEVKPETKSEAVTESETKSEPVSEPKTEETSAVSEPKTEELSATQEAPAEIKSDKAEEEDDYDDPYEFDEDDNKPATSEPSIPVTPTKISTKILIRLPTGWPAARHLDNHVRYLLDFIRKANTALDKAVAKQVREEERSIFKRKRGKEERERDWTKREQVDFRNALMIYGAGPWETIRIRANLHKTAEQTEEFFHTVIEQAKQMASKPIGKNSGNQHVHRDEDEDDKDDVQVDGDEDGEKPTPSRSSSRSKVKEDMNRSSSAMQVMKIGGVEMRLAPISTTMARKLLKRVRLMEDVRTCQKSPDLDTKILKAKLFDMPPWWSPNYDKVLLDTVVKFGIGYNDEWEQYLEAEDCPFFKNLPVGKPDAKKARQKFMKTFLMEKPLVSRLEYLCLIVLDSAQYQHSLYDLPTIVYSTRSGKGDGRKRKREDGDDDLMMDPDKIKVHGRVHLRDVPRDEDGKPMLPYQIKGATILSLGTIVHDRPAFHSRNYIWPAGFKSQRKMPSTKTPGDHVVYTSEILDGGTAPIFQVTPSDNPGAVMQHSTSSGVWCEMLKMIKKKSSVSVSGPEMFGFSDATIKMLIQELPNARLCTQYLWKDFDGNGEPQPGSPSGEQQSEATPTTTKSVGHFDRATREKMELGEDESESNQSDADNQQDG